MIRILADENRVAFQQRAHIFICSEVTEEHICALLDYSHRAPTNLTKVMNIVSKAAGGHKLAYPEEFGFPPPIYFSRRAEINGEHSLYKYI